MRRLALSSACSNESGVKNFAMKKYFETGL
jgi:hypothetical protein